MRAEAWLWRECWISRVSERGVFEGELTDVKGVEIEGRDLEVEVEVEGDVGRGMVMGEAAIARSAASAVSKIATMGRLGFSEVFVVSY